MGKELVKKRAGLLEIMGAKYNIDPQKLLETVKATVMKPGRDGRIATNEEIQAFMIVANKYDLNPFTNEIYAFPSKKGGIIPVVGVDGYVRKICNHTEFDGMEISFSDDMTTMNNAKPCPEWCEVKLYRKGIERPIVVREYLDEVFRDLDYINPWQTHTKRFLRHKTIIQAGRVAGFMTGVYDEDEAQRIMDAEVVESVTMKPAVEIPQAIEGPVQPSEELTDAEKEAALQAERESTGMFSTAAQQKAIHTVVTKIWGKDDKKLYAYIKKEYNANSTKDLTLAQASHLIELLGKELDKVIKKEKNGNLL